MTTKRLRKRADRILEKTNLGDILQKYGFDIDPSSNRDQQFSCRLHGEDTKKSARFFPETNSTYCWTCHKARDVIAYIQELEGLSFVKSLDLLENLLGLDPLPWEESRLKENFKVNHSLSFEEDVLELTDKYLKWLTKDKALPMNDILRYWEAYDLIMGLPESKRKEKMSSLYHLIKSQVNPG